MDHEYAAPPVMTHLAPYLLDHTFAKRLPDSDANDNTFTQKSKHVGDVPDSDQGVSATSRGDEQCELRVSSSPRTRRSSRTNSMPNASSQREEHSYQAKSKTSPSTRRDRRKQSFTKLRTALTESDSVEIQPATAGDTNVPMDSEDDEIMFQPVGEVESPVKSSAVLPDSHRGVEQESSLAREKSVDDGKTSVCENPVVSEKLVANASEKSAVSDIEHEVGEQCLPQTDTDHSRQKSPALSQQSALAVNATDSVSETREEDGDKPSKAHEDLIVNGISNTTSVSEPITDDTVDSGRHDSANTQGSSEKVPTEQSVAPKHSAENVPSETATHKESKETSSSQPVHAAAKSSNDERVRSPEKIKIEQTEQTAEKVSSEQTVDNGESQSPRSTDKADGSGDVSSPTVSLPSIRDSVSSHAGSLPLIRVHADQRKRSCVAQSTASAAKESNTATVSSADGQPPPKAVQIPANTVHIKVEPDSPTSCKQKSSILKNVLLTKITTNIKSQETVVKASSPSSEKGDSKELGVRIVTDVAEEDNEMKAGHTPTSKKHSADEAGLETPTSSASKKAARSVPTAEHAYHQKKMLAAFKTVRSDFSDDTLVIKPLKELGWMREVVVRGVFDETRKTPCDIYYYPPAGKKLRSRVEIAKYLEQNPDCGLTMENFTFVRKPIYKEPHEVVRSANRGGGRLSNSPSTTFTPSPKVFERPKKKVGRPPKPKQTGLSTAVLDSSAVSKSTPKEDVYSRKLYASISSDEDEGDVDYDPISDPAPKWGRKKRRLWGHKSQGGGDSDREVLIMSLPSPEIIIDHAEEEDEMSSASKSRLSIDRQDVETEHTTDDNEEGAQMVMLPEDDDGGDDDEIDLDMEVDQIDDDDQESGGDSSRLSEQPRIRPKVKPTARKSTMPRIALKFPSKSSSKSSKKSPKLVLSEGQLCSTSCPGRGGQPPQLQCSVCMCLFHHECVNVNPSTAPSSFKCLRCKNIRQVPGSEKQPSTPIPPPPLTARPEGVGSKQIPATNQIRPTPLMPPLMAKGGSTVLFQQSDSNQLCKTSIVIPPNVSAVGALRSIFVAANSNNPAQPTGVSLAPPLALPASQVRLPLQMRPLTQPMSAHAPPPPPLKAGPVVMAPVGTTVVSRPLLVGAHTGSLPVATRPFPVATGSLPVATGSFPVVTGSLPVATGSLAVATGSLPVATGSLPVATGSLPVAAGSLAVPAGSLPAIAGVPGQAQLLTLPSHVTGRLNLSQPVALKINQTQIVVPPSCVISTKEGLKVLLPPSTFPVPSDPNTKLSVSVTNSSIPSSTVVISPPLTSPTTVLPPPSTTTSTTLSTTSSTKTTASVTSNSSVQIASSDNIRIINSDSVKTASSDGMSLSSPILPSTQLSKGQHEISKAQTTSSDSVKSASCDSIKPAGNISDNSSKNSGSKVSQPVKNIRPRRQKKQADASSIDPSQCMMHRLFGGFDSMLHIFRYLGVMDLLRASQVCKAWLRIVRQRCLWQDVSLEGLQVSDWDKASQFLLDMGTRSLSLKGMSHYDNDNRNRTWHQLMSNLSSLSCLREIEYGQVPSSIIHSTTEKLTQLQVFKAEHITDFSNEQMWRTPTKVDIGKFASLSKLQELRLRGVSGLALPTFTFSGKLSELTSLQNLHTLSLTSLCALRDCEFHFLGDMQQLEVLELGDCLNWTSETYIQLSKLNKLRRLRLEAGGDIPDDVGLGEAISQLTNLESLELILFAVPHTLGAALNQLENLRVLVIWPDTGNSTMPALVNSHALSAVSELQQLTTLEWGVVIRDDPAIKPDPDADPNLANRSSSIPFLKPDENLNPETKRGDDAVFYMSVTEFTKILCQSLPECTKIKVFNTQFVGQAAPRERP